MSLWKSLPADQMTRIAGNVPAEYVGKSEITALFPIAKGELNKFRLRPSALGEHVESSREALGVVNATTIVGQVFQPATGNINGWGFTGQSAAAETVIDAIEQIDNATLQAAWVLAGTNLATLDTTVVSGNNSSTKSMRLMMDALDSWTKTFAAVDMTGASIEIDYQQTKRSTKATMTITVGDGVNTSTLALPVSDLQKNTWIHKSLSLAAFTGTANVAAITSIAFTVTLANGGEFAYIDNVRLRPAPGSIELKLWDCGATIPVSGVFNLSTDATQYTTLGDLGITGVQVASVVVPLTGGKKLYHVPEFVAGVADELAANVKITPNNFYAITFHYVDTDVSLYGADTTQAFAYYNKAAGFAFSTPAVATAITVLPGVNGAGAYSDLQFFQYATVPAYATKMELKTLTSAGVLQAPDIETGSTWMIEGSDMDVLREVAREHAMGAEHSESLDGVEVLMPLGSKAEIYYNSSVDDPVAFGVMELVYRYIPLVENG